jgi:hypothetical protein
MKLRYFAYIAEQSFTTSPNGERLFLHLGGVFGKPYIIPDPATEKRLFSKQIWFLRICLVGIVLSQLSLSLVMPNIFERPVWLVFYFVAVMFFAWLLQWLLFRNDIPKLRRAPSRLSLPTYYREIAKRHSTLGLVLGFLSCMVFVCAGAWLVWNKFSPLGGWVGILLFGFLAVFWIYALYLKLDMLRENEAVDKKNEA